MDSEIFGPNLSLNCWWRLAFKGARCSRVSRS